LINAINLDEIIKLGQEKAETLKEKLQIKKEQEEFIKKEK
jgi:hypothetical protein